MKIAIITDGNNNIGMGHVYQSMTLAQSLSKILEDESGILFITKSDHSVIQLLESTGFPVHSFSSDDLIFQALAQKRPYRIIFDKLDVSPSLAERIKNELKIKLIIFTNLTEANTYADITIMAGMGSGFKNIKKQNKRTQQIQFWGPKYWLIRPEFYNYSNHDFKGKNHIENIMFIFGGSDQANFSSSMLDVLLSMKSSYRILVVLGNAFAHHKELSDTIKKFPEVKRKSVTIVENITDIAKYMHRMDVVFTSPGLSFFESLLVGAPVLCFPQNKFQQDAWAEYIPLITKDQIGKVPELLENKSFIFPNDPFITAMEIGKGSKEIFDEILC